MAGGRVALLASILPFFEFLLTGGHASPMLTRFSSSHRSPRAPRGRVVAVVLVAAVAAIAPLTAMPVLATTRGDGLRSAVNERRVAAGLSPVAGTALLDSIADARADQMVAANALEHDMDYVRGRLDAAGVCWSGFGEIIAWSSYSTYSYEGTIEQWWNSPTHKSIMMGASYDVAGGSWATASDGSHYSVMVFVDLCMGSVAETTSLLQPAQVYSPDRPMVFRKGTHTAYRFAADGTVLDTKVLVLDRRSSADAAGRTRLNGKAWIKVSTGALAGYWVHESWRSFVRGTTQKRTFASLKRLAFDAGTYTGYTFDKLGRVTGKRTATLGRASGADAKALAIINGRRYWLIANGIWAGYWVRDTKHVDPA